MRLWIPCLLVALALSACAPIYTPPVEWSYDAPKTDDDFYPDQTECVANFDPGILHKLDNDGEYQVTGLFVDTTRTAAVVSCMEAKGWDLEGPEWYNGPVR